MQSTAVFYLLVLNYRYTLSQKCTEFETLQLKIIWINFLGIWQKYSKDSRIEFAFLSTFRVSNRTSKITRILMLYKANAATLTPFNKGTILIKKSVWM